jgi:hypothetical protein
MTNLTTADLSGRLDAATEAEADCTAQLERLQAESLLAGEEPSEAERKAESALAEAKAAIARLEVAVAASGQRDARERRAAVLAEIDRADTLTIETLANVEKAAAKLAAASEAYVRGYDALVRAVGTAQQFVSENPRLAADTRLPSPEQLTREGLGRLGLQGAQPPGSAFHSAQYPDVSRIEPLTARYESYTRHFKDQLVRSRAQRVAA